MTARTPRAFHLPPKRKTEQPLALRTAVRKKGTQILRSSPPTRSDVKRGGCREIHRRRIRCLGHCRHDRGAAGSGGGGRSRYSAGGEPSRAQQRHGNRGMHKSPKNKDEGERWNSGRAVTMGNLSKDGRHRQGSWRTKRSASRAGCLPPKHDGPGHTHPHYLYDMKS